ncbi:MAG: choice-of-anchor R domain-containing protein [Phycisphaerales bacterium]
MKTQFNIVLAALASATLAPAASADVLVSNLDERISFSGTISGGGTGDETIFSSRFVTGSSLYEVLSATASLSNGTGHGVATFEAFIYTDDGTGPGSVVASFDTMPTIADGGGDANVSFSSTLGITLDANTAYWFGVRNTTGSYMGWNATSSDTEVSSAGWTIDDSAWSNSFNHGNTWHDWSGIYGGDVLMYSINGNTVPTPGALALLGAGGVFASRRRRD